MSLDPYQPCPACVGTDKKVKFCCSHLAGPMEKVARLQEGGQTARAIEELRGLLEKNPGNAWVATSLAAQLMDEAEIGEARSLLHSVLKVTPDHPFALALLATLAFAVEGYTDSKPVVHRALQKAAPVYPELLARVVVGAAAEHIDEGRYMAAREHLALGLRLVRDDEDRGEVFRELLTFEGDGSIPYPLRSVHQFAPYEGTEEEERQLLLAVKLSYLGLWSEAAGVLAKLVETHPDDPALLQNLGFCHSWDGNLPAASEALHHAAAKQEDFESAVELETIAQLIDLDSTGGRVKLEAAVYEVPRISQLLSEFEGRDRLVKLPPQPEDAEDGIAGVFYLLDRDVPTGPLHDDASPDDVAHVLGQIVLFPSDPDRNLPPRASIGGLEGVPFDAVKSAFDEVLGDRAKPLELADEPDSYVSAEWQGMNWRWYFHPDTPAALRRELGRQQWERVVHDVFPTTKFTALGDRTPTEATGDPAARVALAALIAVFDAQGNRSDNELDVGGLRERCGLERPAPYPVTDETPLNTLSSSQLVRVPVEQLPDERINEVVNRALMIRHNGFLRRLLAEVLKRPSCRESVDLDRCHQTLAELERNRFDYDAALGWVEAGRESDPGGNDFETQLRWRMLELRYRLERRHDPGLRPLLDQMWNYFGGKLPELRSYLFVMVKSAGIEPPWSEAELLAPDVAGAGTTSPGGLWTPGSDSPPPPTTEGGEQQGGGQLWIPGS